MDCPAGWCTITHCEKHDELPQRENISFIEPQVWPPNSPDLNPVDYDVWCALQQQVNLNRKFTTIDQLKQAIAEEWNKLYRSASLTAALMNMPSSSYPGCTAAGWTH